MQSFRDPLAERLAGEHGRAIVAGVPRTTRNGWWLVARTKIIDDAIAEAITDGCGCPPVPSLTDADARGCLACPGRIRVIRVADAGVQSPS
jgi:hypothetical protein